MVKKDNEIQIEFMPFVKLGLILILLVIAFYIGRESKPSQVSDMNRQQKIKLHVESYLEMHEIKISQFTINENMTLAQVRQMYNNLKTQPPVYGVLESLYDSFCVVD